MDKILIVDGNSLAYRAYYAMPLLTNGEGIYTGSLYGFLNMLLKVLDEAKPEYIVVAFDFSKKTFRNQLYEPYKATRKETPEELRAQFPLLKELLVTMGIKIIEVEGIEADDIIGTVAKSSGIENIILSGDRDVLQLIDKKTSVWLTKKGISEIHKIDESNIKSVFGVDAKGIIELKALMGDVSDNIPGVKGVGPKTAQELIEKYGDIENVFRHVEEQSTSVKNKLTGSEDMARLSKQLATIKTDCEIGFKLDECKLKFPFPAKAKVLLERYKFNSILRKPIFSKEKVEEVLVDEKRVLQTEEELEASLNREIKAIAFNFVGGFEFALETGVFYTIKENFDLFFQPIDEKDTLGALKRYLEDESVEKITYDYKAHMHFLDEYGIKVRGDVFDIQLASYILGAEKKLEYHTSQFFSKKDELLSALKTEHMEELYDDIESPLQYVLYDMENAGFKINKTELENVAKKYSNELEDLERAITVLAGEEFNIKSPKQLAHILFDKLKLKSYLSKKQSTNIEVLNSLVDEHPIIPLIIRFRKIQKLNSTYVEAYLELVEKKGDIIHTVFNQTLTSTGRLSSSEPNLQNIPVRDEEGKALRALFISRFENGKIVSADYNQIELRLMAHFSGDQKLVEAYREGKDIHTLTASQIFGVPESEVTSVLRRRAKAVNFGIIYGISDYGLSQNIRLSRKEAKEYIDKYFETYSGVKEYMESNVKKARELGYAQTMFGRIRRIPEINSTNYTLRAFGERVAMNMPLQGTASDIIKKAMIKVFDKINELGLKSKLILQIHDELIIDAHPDEIGVVEKILKECMENVVHLSVPLPVEISAGNNWLECK